MMKGPIWMMVIEMVATLRERPEMIRRFVQSGDVQRTLCEAMGAEYDRSPRYDGEKDVRVAWVREVIKDARERLPHVETESWPAVEYLLDRKLDAYWRERGAA